MTQATVLYDDACDKCSRWARFIERRNPRASLRTLGQQSQEGLALMDSRPAGLAEVDSVFIVTEEGDWHAKSAAVWRIALKLRFPWPLAAVMWLVPGPIRDLFYDIYASRR